MSRQLADKAAVLFANEAFYVAFRTKDLAAMDEIWSPREEVTCIHPGWQALRSREEVMASWRGILEAEHAPDVSVHLPRVNLLGESAIVVCYERVEDADLAATNVFAREPDGWKLIHHHSGICQGRPEEEAESDTLAMIQ